MMDGARTKTVQVMNLVKVTQILSWNVMRNVTETRSALHSLTKPQHLPNITTATLIKEGHTQLEVEGPTQNVTYRNEVRLPHSTST